ncbi:Hsp20/alpha crystallin family protein [Ancylostoma caninum]|uniref:Hsp20/alpha crystallin family protein n=1 Tax=Ancylostoma caninum TaxID=29170 RepID=A0A368H2I0_ANCCA|nr:Hsp20/alpha crystallin family protein [Ancylostoma caninum]
MTDASAFPASGLQAGNLHPCAVVRCRTRYPSSTQNHYDYSPQENRSSYRDSRIDSKGVTVVSRPGSPGPVAGAGDVINTPHGFTIQLDVKLFKPEQIKVVLTEDLLCVSGERIEVGAGGQTLKRSFARKYCIPSDIHLDSIRSHLDHNGVLIINGSRRGWRETHISVHPHSYGDRRSNSLISTV